MDGRTPPRLYSPDFIRGIKKKQCMFTPNCGAITVNSVLKGFNIYAEEILGKFKEWQPFNIPYLLL